MLQILTRRRSSERMRVRVRATVVYSPEPSIEPAGPLRRVRIDLLQFWLPALLLVLVAALLRFVWLADMEFKRDERWTYDHVMAATRNAHWPALGMPTSQNTPNPGMSVWVFIALGKATGVETPTDLARVCQWTNVLALAGLVVFARFCVPRSCRGHWFWAAALVAVNPIAVLMQRKIWPPSVCPLLLVWVLLGFWHRERRWGAALWGFVVMIVAQISLAGLFLATGVAVWTAVTDRQRVRWRWWMLGSVLGGWPLVPWALAVSSEVLSHPSGQIKLGNAFTFNYWLRWFTEPFGLSLQYSLHEDFGDFLRYPIVGGYSTYSMALVHFVLLFLCIYLLVRTAQGAWMNRWRLGQWLTGADRDTAIALGSVMFGFGLAITGTALPIHRHYMLLTFPFMYLWLAASALVDRRPGWFGLTRGQTLLASLVLLQSAATVGFLDYVHSNQRTLLGDYGTPYAAQINFGLPPK
jgi:hypothetical protein